MQLAPRMQHSCITCHIRVIFFHSEQLPALTQKLSIQIRIWSSRFSIKYSKHRREARTIHHPSKTCYIAVGTWGKFWTMTPWQIPPRHKDPLKEWHIANWTSIFKVKFEKCTLWMAQNPLSQYQWCYYGKTPSCNEPESDQMICLENKGINEACLNLSWWP